MKNNKFIAAFAAVLCSNFVFIVYSLPTNENEVLSPRGLNAKDMLSTLAGNLMSRGYGLTSPGVGGSQVVSLNLTNLLVLVLLKALIFAAGSIGAGHWKEGGLGRSLDSEEESILSEDEILLFLSYLTGSPGNNGCLQSVACRQPSQAKRYASAGDLLLKASNLISIDSDKNYQIIVKEVEEAAELGSKGGDCSIYTCR